MYIADASYSQSVVTFEEPMLVLQLSARELLRAAAQLPPTLLAARAAVFVPQVCPLCFLWTLSLRWWCVLCACCGPSICGSLPPSQRGCLVTRPRAGIFTSGWTCSTPSSEAWPVFTSFKVVCFVEHCCLLACYRASEVRCLRSAATPPCIVNVISPHSTAPTRTADSAVSPQRSTARTTNSKSRLVFDRVLSSEHGTTPCMFCSSASGAVGHAVSPQQGAASVPTPAPAPAPGPLAELCALLASMELPHLLARARDASHFDWLLGSDESLTPRA
jgi:hypothetical protein